MWKVFRFLLEKASFVVALVVRLKEILMNRPSSGEFGGGVEGVGLLELRNAVYSGWDRMMATHFCPLAQVWDWRPW